MPIRPRRIEIPPRLVEILDRDAVLAGAVRIALADFEPWLEDNKLVFFPEYTDHGPDHIRQVLDTASSLIADAAWLILTPGDVAALILSTLLHDCAMHLSEEGFIALVTGRQQALEREVPWPEAWRQFLSEASRFDGRKLTALFGDAERIRVPRLDGPAMDRRDRLLIGEFLRRHHARLAHEIASFGVPGPGTERLGFQAVPRWMAELSGLIARSHGMSIRAATERLPAYERRVYRDVHAPFIMAVLRIADYLQVHGERAPATLLHVRSLSSPVSRGEWAMHAIIETIHAFDDDPEALFIVASPRTAVEFTKAHALFESIQRELDETWAVLGEVYGRVHGLNALGLTLRRIKSNLDDIQAFSRTVDFVPVTASFTSAGGELLKLLVGPLYNNDPKIAVREMLQNAVDAVVELRDYLSMERRPPHATTDADVTISIDTQDARTLTIDDRGIGMTAETIVDYFLRAGASFRNSDSWRSQHAPDGSARISRSGRFGIGALAAFLAGNRIHVTTRHVSAPTGIQFSAAIDDPSIELKRISRDVGTTVRIELRPDVLDMFRRIDPADWDWYCLTDPAVKRLFNGTELKQQIEWPPVRAQLPPEWRRIAIPGYSDVQYMFGSNTPTLACNGLAISQLSSALEHGLRGPNLSVFDGDTSLPLDLRRERTIEPLPFASILREDIVRDVVARAAAEAPEEPGPLASRWSFHHPALYDPQEPHGGWLFWTPRGWALAHASSLADLDTDRIVIVNEFAAAARYLNAKAHAVIGLQAVNNAKAVVAAMNATNSRWWSGAASGHLLVPWNSAPAIHGPKLRAEPFGRWMLLSWGEPFQPSLDFGAIAARHSPELLQAMFIGEVIPRKPEQWTDDVAFVSRWREILPGGILPAPRSERGRFLAQTAPANVR